ncbi:alpha/beta fold hydrolase [Flammeovirga agarivorans]|uniref:Alpha/beta hydrolase n=1 Tax=Flammeovirga agarivorans TaxID=2726742 RepID=A0A7X8XW06_9BACT|nr:alpha/beta hydrolase [Flammeovirga agarivorans]NLR91759.1 alpha/beta hydrolase [Flammeovirga agarivorans]
MNYSIALLIIGILSVQYTLAQNPKDYISGFFYKMDISAYQGGEYQFTARAKSDTLSPNAGSYLYVRMDGEKDNLLSYQGSETPIQKHQWETYSIRGKINKKAKSILVGGQCLFQGKYFFDDFVLKVRTKNGSWKDFNLPNSDFGVNQKNHTSQRFTLPEQCTVSVQEIADKTKPLVVDASQIIVHGFNDQAGKYLTCRNVTFYYETYGEGEPLLLLHGNAQSIKDYAAQIPVLAKKYKVIAVDTRGHGKSTEDGTPLSYNLFAEDMLAFIDHLKIEKVNVLGWSDGGNTALIMAMKAPEKINKLAVMGANLYNDKTSVLPEINSQLRKRIKVIEKKNLADTFEGRLLYLLRDEPNINPEDLTKIDCPTLVMVGENDYFFKSHTRLIAEKINNAQLVVFVDGTHEEPIKNPDRFNATVLSFLEEKKVN